MDNCRIVENKPGIKEGKENLEEKEKNQEVKMRTLHQFVSRDLEVNQPNGNWLSDESLWIGHNDDSHQTTNIWFKKSKLLPRNDGLQTSISSIYKGAVDRASIYVTAGFFNTLGDMSLVVGSVSFKGSLSTISTLLKKSWGLKTPCCLVFMPFTWVNSHQMISELPTICWIVILSTACSWVTFPMWFQIRVDQKNDAAQDLRERSETQPLCLEDNFWVWRASRF